MTGTVSITPTVTITPSPLPVFAGAVNYNVGFNPQNIIIKDLTGDGKLDLAVTNLGAQTFSILQAYGDGTFYQPATNYTTGLLPYGIAAADLNGNGSLDLVVTNDGIDTLSVLLNTGSGIFSTPTNYIVGLYPTEIVIQDFNRDGKFDIAVGIGADTVVSILQGNGDGTFHQPATNYTVDLGPLGLIAGDFDKDGKIDLATTNQGGTNTISILQGKGDGTFHQPATNYAVSDLPNEIIAADLNNNGNLDLIVTLNGNSVHGIVQIFLGYGNGTFQLASNYTVGGYPYGVVAVDVNGDGNLDLAVGGAPNIVSLFLGYGDGTFQAAWNYTVYDFPVGLAASDLDGDGRIDIVAANGLYGVSVLMNIFPMVVSSTLTVTASRTNSISVSPTVTKTSTVTFTTSITSSVTPTRSATESVSPSTTTTATFTPSVTATASVTNTVSITTTKTAAVSCSDTSSASITPTITYTPTVTASFSATTSSSVTASSSRSGSVTATYTTSVSPTVTDTTTLTDSTSPSRTLSVTPTASSSGTLSATGTYSSSSSISTSSTLSPTITSSVTPTYSTSASSSVTMSASPTITTTTSSTNSSTNSASSSGTLSATGTYSSSSSISTSSTLSPTITSSVTPTCSTSASSSVTASSSHSGSVTATYTTSASATVTDTTTLTDSTSPSRTLSVTPTISSSSTLSATGTYFSSSSISISSTLSPTITSSVTPTYSTSASSSVTMSTSPTLTSTVSASSTHSSTKSAAFSRSYSATDSVSKSPSPSFIPSPIAAYVQTNIFVIRDGDSSCAVELTPLTNNNHFIMQEVSTGLNYTVLNILVRSSGDFNGDMILDHIISTPLVNNQTGQINLIYGRSYQSFILKELPLSNTDEGIVISGANPGDLTGYSVCSVNINGDGFSDVAIGEPGVNNRAGQVTVSFGNGLGFVVSGRDRDLVGYSVVDIGDVDGDGVDDLAVSAPGFMYNTGMVVIIRGQKGGFQFSSPIDLIDLAWSHGSIIFGINNNAGFFGASVTSGNFDGDQFRDLIICAPAANNETGLCYLLNGNREGFSFVDLLNGTGFKSKIVISGINEGDLTGFTVNKIGDINGDDIDDFAVGSPRANNNTGIISVYFGGSALNGASLISLNGRNGFVIKGVSSGDNLGSYSVINMGDHNGDGRNDFLINNAIGESWVIWGKDITTDGDFIPEINLGLIGTDGMSIGNGYYNGIDFALQLAVLGI